MPDLSRRSVEIGGLMAEKQWVCEQLGEVAKCSEASVLIHPERHTKCGYHYLLTPEDVERIRRFVGESRGAEYVLAIIEGKSND